MSVSSEENRQCQNCKQSFIVAPEDFQFYEKIQVPPPTWCPECRQMRRLAWRNERTLYRHPCDLCGKSSVTIYSSDKPFKVYCPTCWWGDGWNGMDLGREFDFNRPFFPQFQEMQLQVPRISLLTKNSVGSDYTNHANNNKNCYLGFCVYDSENVMYSANVYDGARDSADCYRITQGNDRLYECIDVMRCYQCQFGILLRDCRNCFYCYDCRNCSDCFLSANLRNKQYCIENVQYSKEEYMERIKSFSLDSFEARARLAKSFEELMRTGAIHRFAVIEKSNDVSGNVVINSKNSHQVFDTEDSENLKYCIVCPDVKDSMDVYHVGFNMELIYEAHALIHNYDTQFSHLSYDNSHLQYCDGCHNSENLFGCVGLKHAKYAIFNRQYSEEEYGALRKKIIEHMRKTGEYGEFFPPALCPFGYNETQGAVYMPLSKDQALAYGFKWQEQLPGTYGKETLPPEQVPDRIGEVPDSITKEALRCVSCTKNYNIVSPEIEFYRKESIPVPRKCPDCRYKNRIAIRTPRKLWQRACMCMKENHGHPAKCPNEFKTSYAPDRPEMVYCEQCYNAEVV